MNPSEGVWTATVAVRTRNERLARMLERALRPEVDREVPRARAELRSPTPDTIELAISARDSGAVRAALNTYLGWIQLSLATAESVRGSSRFDSNR